MRLLTRLGIPKLWDDDPEILWSIMRLFVPRITERLAPSYCYGVERMPARGGLVVAANHFAAIDPPLVGSCSPRPIWFMTKEEVLATPVAGELIRWTGTFAVRRGESDREALRRAREVVRRGHVLGMFVEGTRQRTPPPGTVQPGALLVAIQEGVPVQPCGVDTFGWMLRNRRRCAVVWGEPLDVSGLPRSSRGYREGAALVQEELRRLWRLAAHAVAAGFPEALPDGARRRALLPPLAPSVAEVRARRNLTTAALPV